MTKDWKTYRPKTWATTHARMRPWLRLQEYLQKRADSLVRDLYRKGWPDAQ